MKYRIVQTEDNKYGIQQKFLFRWKFVLEPTAKEHKAGFIRDVDNLTSYIYYTLKEAKSSLDKILEGTDFYRKFCIDLMLVWDEYKGEYNYRYFVKKGILTEVYNDYFNTKEQAKKYIDNYWKEKEIEKKRYTIKKVIWYY